VTSGAILLDFDILTWVHQSFWRKKALHRQTRNSIL